MLALSCAIFHDNPFKVWLEECPKFQMLECILNCCLEELDVALPLSLRFFCINRAKYDEPPAFELGFLHVANKGRKGRKRLGCLQGFIDLRDALKSWCHSFREISDTGDDTGNFPAIVAHPRRLRERMHSC